jgi:hypothetical protein
VTIDAVTTKVDVAALYLRAMRANAPTTVEIAPDTSPALPGDSSEEK